MKAETARLLRAVLRLVERDVTELADAVVQIDEREAAHFKAATDDRNQLLRRVAALEQTLVSFDHSRRV